MKTQDGEGEVDNIEILKERVRVKIKDGDGILYKKYDAKDIKVIKDAVAEKMNEEEVENKKELDELEKLEKQDQKEKITEKHKR